MFGVMLGLDWGLHCFFGVMLGGIILGIILGYLGIILGLRWGYIGIILGFWDYIEPCLEKDMRKTYLWLAGIRSGKNM